MRLFLAIRLGDAHRRAIHSAAGPLRQAELPVRWVEPGEYHLTLKFLGEVRSETLPGLSKAVGRVTSSTREFPMDIAGFGAFPTIRRPQVLWVGVEPTPALRCLKQDLEWALADHGFERETRAFHPHITLGRVEGNEGAGAFRGLDALAAGLTFREHVAAKSVDVVRSHLSRQGVRYSLLEGFRLAEQPAPDPED